MSSSLVAEIYENNYSHSEINRKIEENRAMNAYLLSQTEIIKEYLDVEEKEYVERRTNE